VSLEPCRPRSSAARQLCAGHGFRGELLRLLLSASLPAYLLAIGIAALWRCTGSMGRDNRSGMSRSGADVAAEVLARCASSASFPRNADECRAWTEWRPINSLVGCRHAST